VPVEKEMIQPKASSSNKNKAQKKDVEMEQITSSYVKQALNEVMGGEETGKDDDTENMSDDDSSSDDGEVSHGKGKKRRHGKKKDKKQKDCEKIPKKAFKKMIRKEMDKQCQSIF